MVSAQGLKTAIVTGPTATGKTSLALKLARELGLHIVNADSLLVYREMNIGTAKPTREEIASVPHHLIDIKNPDENFTAGDFARVARDAVAEIHASGGRALIVGGTGFYLKALLFGVWDAPAADPEVRRQLEMRENQELYSELARHDGEAALRIGVNDRYRLIRALEILHLTGKTPSELQAAQPKDPDSQFELLVLDRANDELYRRISQRTQLMLDQGFIEEAKKVRAQYPTSRALGAVGYAQVFDYLDGVLPPGRKTAPGLDGLKEEIELATRQLVKSQRTWFRGQKYAQWFQLDEDLTRLEAKLREIYAP